MKKNRLQQREFEKMYHEVSSALSRMRKKEDELACIDYLMHLIRVRLSAQGRLNAFYSSDEVLEIFPNSFMSKSTKKIKKIRTGEIKKFKLDSETYVTTWKKDSILTAFLKVFNSGGYRQSSSHEAIYYQELELLHIVNGLHSSSAGIYLGGEIEAEVYSIAPLFEDLMTDGAFWFTPSGMGGYHRFKELTVPDYHIAVLYELAKEKYQLLS